MIDNTIKDRLDKLLAVIEQLRIEFPVAEIARKTGYGEPTISQYLNGKTKASTKFLKTFCEVYQLDYDTIFHEPNATGDDLRKKKAFTYTEDEGLVYVPIAAQAGYAIHHMEPIFIQDLDKLYIPGNKFKGDHFRYFEVEGDSMEPTLSEGMQVIAQKIEPEYWKQIQDYYIHVIVTASQILIKRLVKIDDDTVAVISDNEEMYEQQAMPYSEIKELWLVRRRIDWAMAPPKRVELKIKRKS